MYESSTYVNSGNASWMRVCKPRLETKRKILMHGV
ncbi:hypothetical protein A420_0265 [Listeria monocytogenes serotype 4b str. 02-6679]|nr:hypothetical protein LMOf2365_0273 [Listeria monocytogenes serotype 4b str. F2365]AHF28116.1 hypothetical protein A407_0332 [Listeria monocytogenes serotype 4b str. 81-0861]ASG92920.1 hypothetical protein A420_0265 [Listeria monocytogenes serotype 4b str. 02-6679]ASH31317.1 hypothetical protein A408_0335 [Listeria monocytogenes serotype 4b str. 10-0809]ASH34167.1 hypothetical protein A409_0260 [Listeria monocytogenes serotype 1/2b str. 10-0810]ASH37131.1 hypothetical protein A410_0262 [List